MTRYLIVAVLVLALCGSASGQAPEDSLYTRDDGQAFVLFVPRANIVLRLPKGGFQPGAPPVKEGVHANPRYFIFRESDSGMILSGWIESSTRFPGVKTPPPIRLDGMVLHPEKVAFGKIGDWQTVSSELSLQGTAVAKLNAHLVRDGTWIELNLTAKPSLPIEQQHASLNGMVASLTTSFSTAERLARVMISRRMEQMQQSWPDAENWTVVNRRDSGRTTMIQFVRKGESLENWTQMGTVVWNADLRAAGIRGAYERYAAAFNAACPGVRLAIHVVEESAEDPRLIFSQECSKAQHTNRPESGVWMFVQKPDAIYVMQRTHRAEALPEELRTQWIEAFKSTRIAAR